MGLLKRLFGGDGEPKRKRPRTPGWRGPGVLVRVKFRELHDDNYDRGSPYTYVWDIQPWPEIGSRAFVDGSDGLTPVVVVDFGLPDDLRGHTPDRIIRVASTEAVQRAHDEIAARAIGWLDLMRDKAGLPTSGAPLPPKCPKGYPAIPRPSGNTADPDKADRYGSAWWRAYKNAENDDEAERFKEIALHWYRMRDRLKKQGLEE